MKTDKIELTNLELGAKELDDTHLEFLALLKQLNAAPNEGFIKLFPVFLEHTQNHFEQEELLMQKFQDPNLAEHQAEHRRIIAELTQFHKRVATGRISFAKAYINDKLPQWFELHTTTMDAALAAKINNGN